MKFFITFLISILSLSAWSQDGGLMVIGNLKGAPTELKFTELKSLLKGEQQRWRNGSKVSIAVMKPNTSIGQQTCEKVLGMSGNEANRFWIGLTFAGKEGAPHTFNNLEDLQNYVAENPGAIGIVDKSSNLPDTQIVTIDGRKTM